MSMETFENIHMDFSTSGGRCRFAESGLGWKPSGDKDSKENSVPFTLGNDQMQHAYWNRSARGYELKIYRKDRDAPPVVQFDGFTEEDYDRIGKIIRNWYGLPFDKEEHSLRGWNWGKAEFGKAELSFNVQSRSAFTIPYTEVSNTNLAGKGEVAVEFSLPGDGEQTGTNGHLGGARAGGNKAGAARDQLVEMRFYIPGMTSVKGKDEDGEDGEVNEDAEEQQAADVFYQTLSEKAEIGEVAGDTIATFQDVLHLTPRGRFDIDMYKTSFRLRGKTYDYKIQYESIKKFMILPKPDEMHVLLTIGLDPPLRQGQTRYPFVVMQMVKEDERQLELNMKDEDFEKDYKGKLQQKYEAPLHSIVAALFRGLAGKKLTMPSKDFTSHHHANGVKCSIKANEGLLFCLDKSFMFVPKPSTYVNMDQITLITMSRIGGAMAASRTFDITMTMRGGGEFQFSNINREEQKPLEDFFRIKGLKIKNEMAEEEKMTAAILNGMSDGDDSEDEAVGADRGSADEDSEEADEDFQDDDDSDVAEEYDSQHESEGGDSDAEMDDADADGGSDEEMEEERPKKKAKTGK